MREPDADAPPESDRSSRRLIGHAVERVEDAALLTGRGRFADDVGERPGTAHAAVLRSPYAHAELVSRRRERRALDARRSSRS